MSDEKGSQIDLRDRIDALISVYGGYRQTARAIGVDCPYLHRLRKGNKTNPSDATCTKLGLVKQVDVKYYQLKQRAVE